MSEEESWRSEAAYEYIDTLAPGDLAWEFLRRNPDYRNAYQQLVSIGRLTEEVAQHFAEQWGCDFAADPRTSALIQPIFWTPQVDPATLPFTDGPTLPKGLAFTLTIYATTPSSERARI